MKKVLAYLNKLTNRHRMKQQLKPYQERDKIRKLVVNFKLCWRHLNTEQNYTCSSAMEFLHIC